MQHEQNINESKDSLSQLNAKFWNEACGTKLAQRTNTLGDYQAFDREYFKLYPFLPKYLDKMKGYVLEIGVGYGSVASYLNSRCMYYAVDIAERPLEILEERGLDPWQGWQGNALNLQFRDRFFDGVVSIGCLHHTGNIPLAISEIHRVLRVGGRALIMLYNSAAKQLPVDINSKGEVAPHIEYTSYREVFKLFKAFSSVTVTCENGDQNDLYIEAIR